VLVTELTWTESQSFMWAMLGGFMDSALCYFYFFFFAFVATSRSAGILAYFPSTRLAASDGRRRIQAGAGNRVTCSTPSTTLGARRDPSTAGFDGIPTSPRAFAAYGS